MPGPGRGLGALALLIVLLAVLLFGDEGDDPSGGARADRDADVPGRSLTVPVSRVVDGDTFEIEVDGETDDVRLIGVDTPETVKPGEPVECFGAQASDYAHHLLDGRTVTLEFDRERRDVYDRLLAYAYIGDRFVNAELVRGGYARTLEIEPNTSQAPLLARLEREAGAAGRGLWGAC